jgi:microcystin degradation protein MlrC
VIGSLRIAIGGFYHETNTFSAKPTHIADFHAYQFAAGDALLEKYAGTNTEMGGMIGEAKVRDVSLVPLVFAAAVPSGVIDRAAFEAIAEELEQGLRQAGQIDGLLLVLHGAAVADGYPDADSSLVAMLRKRMGQVVPVAVTVDFHANLSRNLIADADFVCGYDTYPHTDMADRGAEAARIIIAIARGEGRPHVAFRKLSFVTVPVCQSTDEAPMADISKLRAETERAAGIVSVTITMGFAYADCADLGATVVVYADTQRAADEAANRLAAALWSLRESFQPKLVALQGLADVVANAPGGPLIVVDPADNVGGGSAGDGTSVLAELLKARVDGSVVVIADPAAVAEAYRVGAGNTFDAKIGGKIDGLHGPPVGVRGTVRRVLDASYQHTGSYMTGFVTHMGRTAVVDADGVQVVLTSQRTMPFDAGHLTCVGIAPEQQRVIVVKSAIAWRAAFCDVAAQVITVDTPGVCPANLARLNYENAPRPLWPLDSEVTYP